MVKTDKPEKKERKERKPNTNRPLTAYLMLETFAPTKDWSRDQKLALIHEFHNVGLF